MDRKVDVAILGAGSAGLSAAKEVRKVTKDFVVINGGPHGTTCARVGCMPSKVLIQVANDFHRRHQYQKQGLRGGDGLSVDSRAVMAYVREMRDSFVGGVLDFVGSLGEASLDGYARFEEPTVLRVGKTVIRAKRVILATGSRPWYPGTWKGFADKIMTSDTIFEEETLPASAAVVGMGVIGIELGQAMSRLGVKVAAFGRSKRIGGLSDPKVIEAAAAIFGEEFALHLGEEAEVTHSDGKLLAGGRSKKETVDKVLAALGRKPNIDGMGLEKLGVPLAPNGIPRHDRQTLRVGNLPLFIAGDVTGERSVLHEASDEGRIAGFNALQDDSDCFKRRVPLKITFSEPNIAVVGAAFAELGSGKFAVGEADFAGQGRAHILSEPHGLMRIYGELRTGRLLGAEMAVPRGEHMAHTLALAIQQGLTATEMLTMPFYHPVLEEGLRGALRDLSKKAGVARAKHELTFCDPKGAQSLC